jgi:NADPH-dependent 2,4-dienoyl-CoA reductase/sulfur reductase-like enzyme
MHLVIIGGSDAGIAAALRARELDRDVAITVLVADGYPNFSICGIPYYLSGEVPSFERLAHRDRATIEALGIEILTDTTALALDIPGQKVVASSPRGVTMEMSYDQLIVATGAVPVRAPITGIGELGPDDGFHYLHTIDDARAVMTTLEERHVAHAAIVGAGYIGLEMTEALRRRGIETTLFEYAPQVLPTLDPELADVVRRALEAEGVHVHTATKVTSIARRGTLLEISAEAQARLEHRVIADCVLVVTGVAPNSTLAAAAGIETDARGAIVVDEGMHTNAPCVLAAGDCARTYHRLLGWTYLPLGTTAHKQGRVAGENALGGHRRFAGSLGTQAVKVFDLAVVRTGLRDSEARAAGFAPFTHHTIADDHKRYYPGASEVSARITGDRPSGRLIGVQMVGAIASGVHKRIDTAAAAIFAGATVDSLTDLDLSYTPPLGTPWDLLQVAALEWQRALDDAPRAVRTKPSLS